MNPYPGRTHRILFLAQQESIPDLVPIITNNESIVSPVITLNDDTPFLMVDEDVIIEDITDKNASVIDLYGKTNDQENTHECVENINTEKIGESSDENTNEKEAEEIGAQHSTDEVGEDDTTKKGTKRKRRKYETPLKERKLKKIEENKVAHKIHQPCDVNKCKKKCVKEFTEDERIIINKKFWELNYKERRVFILNNAIKKSISRRRGSEDSSRKNTFSYSLKNNNSRVEVCKTFFLTTLGFSKNNNTVVRDVLCQGSPKSDRRGKHEQPSKVDRNVIRTHIESFHPCVSHYRREHAPNKRYLPSDITVSSMHKHFQTTHENFKCSYDLYRSIVSEMNISFTKLGHEECESCEFFSLHNRDHTKENLMADCDDCMKWKVHIEKAKEARLKYREDGETFQNEKHVFFSADLQKVIMLPRMDTFKTAIFTQRIIVFNETFAPIGKKQNLKPLAVIWNEGVAGRKKDDIVSTFHNFLLKNRDALKITLWLDNCSSQNKNWTLFSFLVYIINSEEISAQEIVINYFEPGHTFMSCDSFHHQDGSIEVENSEEYGWHKGVIKSINENGYSISISDISSSKWFENVKLEELRPITSGPNLSRRSLHRYIVTIPEDVRNYYEKYPEACQFLNKYIRAFTIRVISVSEILVISDYKHSLKYATTLCETYFEYALDFRYVARNTSEFKRNFKQIWNMKCLEKQSVPSDLVRYAIGKGGNNIRKAQKVKGVIFNRLVDKSTFEVCGENEKSVIKARSILNFVEKTFRLDKTDLGKVIGRKGCEIQKITTNCNVAVDTQQTETFIDGETHEEYFEMNIIGPRCEIDRAIFYIERRLQHLKDLALIAAQQRKRLNRYLKNMFPDTEQRTPAARRSRATSAPPQIPVNSNASRRFRTQSACRSKSPKATSSRLSRTDTLLKPNIAEVSAPRDTKETPRAIKTRTIPKSETTEQVLPKTGTLPKTSCKSKPPKVSTSDSIKTVTSGGIKTATSGGIKTSKPPQAAAESKLDTRLIVKVSEIAISSGSTTDLSRKSKTLDPVLPNAIKTGTIPKSTQYVVPKTGTISEIPCAKTAEVAASREAPQVAISTGSTTDFPFNSKTLEHVLLSEITTGTIPKMPCMSKTPEAVESRESGLDTLPVVKAPEVPISTGSTTDLSCKPKTLEPALPSAIKTGTIPKSTQYVVPKTGTISKIPCAKTVEVAASHEAPEVRISTGSTTDLSCKPKTLEPVTPSEIETGTVIKSETTCYFLPKTGTISKTKFLKLSKDQALMVDKIPQPIEVGTKQVFSIQSADPFYDIISEKTTKKRKLSPSKSYNEEINLLLEKKQDAPTTKSVASTVPAFRKHLKSPRLKKVVSSKCSSLPPVLLEDKDFNQRLIDQFAKSIEKPKIEICQRVPAGLLWKDDDNNELSDETIHCDASNDQKPDKGGEDNEEDINAGGDH